MLMGETVSLNCGHQLAQMIYQCGESWWNDIDKGKQKDSEKNLSQHHFAQVGRDSNTGLRGERPVTNHLSHGTAFQ
jgi:hypothetical protein